MILIFLPPGFGSVSMLKAAPCFVESAAGKLSPRQHMIQFVKVPDKGRLCLTMGQHLLQQAYGTSTDYYECNVTLFFEKL